MEILVGDKIIKGDIKRREEAREIYDRAVSEGRTAGLLEQERANIFTQSLANIRPGEDIDVTIRYTESLAFEGGNYEFVFPMVVGPRFVPGTPIDNSGNTDRVPDADRINPPVLKPGERSGHDINVTVEIDAGVPISKIRSTSHAIDITENGGKAEVKLANDDTIPNKDLILRYKVAGKETQATVLTQKDEKGGHFAVYLIPAVDYKKREIVPKDVIFLIDTSGSMQGQSIEQAKALMRRFIEGLNPRRHLYGHQFFQQRPGPVFDTTGKHERKPSQSVAIRGCARWRRRHANVERYPSGAGIFPNRKWDGCGTQCF